MEECLVDVLNARDTVLHVFPVVVEDAAVAPQEALKAATDLHLVPEEEEGSLHARMHVSRGGPLTPFGDALLTRQQAQERSEQQLRTHAYFLWQQAGCPDNRSEDHWHMACAALHDGATAP